MQFYVGTYTRKGGPGIAVCGLTEQELSLRYAADELANPTYVILSRDGKTLLASGASKETGEGVAASYAVQEGRLRLISIAETGGLSACHLALDEAERFLYVANYLSGSVAVFPMEGQAILPRIGLLTHTGRGPHPTRQEGAHAHFVAFRPGTAELFVCDLGIDAVVVYRQDPQTGLLALAEQIPAAPGLGPRHLAFAGPDRFYLACELGNAVCLYERQGGAWQHSQVVSTLPEGWQGQSTVAAIRIHGGEVFVSNRGHDSIARFAIQPDWRLGPLAIEPVSGVNPRDFQVLDSGEMLIACQDAGGLLWTRGNTLLHSLPIAGAVCVAM